MITTPQRSRFRILGMGITRKIALLSWLVTLLTLVVFVAIIIPEQKQSFEENLKSKGRGIAVSLQDVTASSIMSEDFSSVVDHCMQLIQGDPSVSCLIITRQDGFSLIHDRSGWKNETLDATWRPASRAPRSEIAVLPQFQQRLFHYATPFNYSGIEWGWIHVGLSLENYDRSVKRVYRRTGLLAVGCVALSLVISVLYARRLMQPIRHLRSVVVRVGEGDWSARARVNSGDEIQTLAEAFNKMTESLLYRDRIMESVRFAAQEFLSTSDWRLVIGEVLEKIGRAARAQRACLFQNCRSGTGDGVCRQVHAWAAPRDGEPPEPLAAGDFYWSMPGLEGYRQRLENGQVCKTCASEVNDQAKNWLASRNTGSLIFIPVFIEEEWWGSLSLEDVRADRQWTDAELDSLQAAAHMLGGAMARQQAREAVLEANERLEHRVLERTQELQTQIQAKEHALAKLAEAQNSLMELSRKSGMAEVATGVLHNVGNVLNSVNVSANLVLDRVRQSRGAGLTRAAGLLQAHNSDLGHYVTQDPKGRLLPDYVIKLATLLEDERAEILRELQHLGKNVEHIKEIVSMQQNYARVAGVIENLPPAQLLEDALRLQASGFQQRGITVQREFESAPEVRVDKHKVLQILLNLLKNARHALDASPAAEKVVRLRIAYSGGNHVQLCVHDNGEGILPENLTRIFQHGFTTKRNGHGFGLHSGALAAKELGGTLTAASDGPGRGATFTLELPVAATLRTA